ncbi:hypothetical protein ARMSODRAFT_1022726 [Armillaria solidipes]|uniref:Uncharacterized protein n=1 Tax=Armillaria solidipes TaxID=1076256 RepID=A0A2H3BKD6_9AGAR|nr:hypothetical protein ARMSODRAFT_1022726 [Armillaria solidipes]
MGNKAKAMIRPTLVFLKGLQAAGDIAPLPYIKGIAALAITILELVDNAFTNNRDIQELVERIGNTVTAVNDVAVTYSRIGSEDMSSIEELCADFHRCLEAIMHEVREMERNNANRGRIVQYLMTPNIRDEINGFVRQVDNLQRNFNTKNILRICANNEVSDNYLRALEHGMRELRAEHSDMNRTLALLLVSHNKLRTQVSNQGGLPGAMSRIAKRDRSKTFPQGTVVIHSTIDPRLLQLQGVGYRNLTDDSPDPRQRPTRKNIIDAMKWLVNDAQSGDTLFFFCMLFRYPRPFFLTEILSLETPEVADKFVPREATRLMDTKKLSLFIDSSILPVDYDQYGDILHEDMYHIMIRPLPTGCRLTVLLSCCHSAGALDLPYVYDSDTHLMSPRPLTSPKLTAADVVIWSGGKGMAVHETVVGGVAVSTFNYAFISSLKMNPKQSCRELLHSLRNRLAARHHNEKPQLVTSSQHIDPDLPATL